MSNYKITQYSYNKAKDLNLNIKVSNNKNKKLDVYTSDNKFIASIGDSLYIDYGHYCIVYNKAYADKRLILYHNRHKKKAEIKCSKQWLALNL